MRLPPRVPSPSGLVRHDGANNEYVAGGGGPPAHDQGRRVRYLLLQGRRTTPPAHPRAPTARAPHARHTRAAHAHRPTTHTPLRLTLVRGAPRAQTLGQHAPRRCRPRCRRPGCRRPKCAAAREPSCRRPSRRHQSRYMHARVCMPLSPRRSVCPGEDEIIPQTLPAFSRS